MRSDLSCEGRPATDEWSVTACAGSHASARAPRLSARRRGRGWRTVTVVDFWSRGGWSGGGVRGVNRQHFMLDRSADLIVMLHEPLRDFEKWPKENVTA